jgi:hypothetical protein
LWPDQLGVALFADRLLMARASRGWKRRLKDKETVVLEPAQPNMPSWQPAIDALGGKIAAGALKGAQISVVLSNCFVHYAIVPWSDALGSEEELALARHCFVRVYGAEAESWVIKLSARHSGKARVACATDAALIDALNRIMAPLGERYGSLQPHLMASFNRWSAQFGEKACWFVAAEPGLLCLALLGDGQWQSVRTVKVGANWMKGLPDMLNRETCLVETTTECKDVSIVCADGADTAGLNAGSWRIRQLMPALLPGMAAGSDAAYSIALGA